MKRTGTRVVATALIALAACGGADEPADKTAGSSEVTGRETGPEASSAPQGTGAPGKPVKPALEPIPADLPPNLILMSLDTCRADRLSCYGSERLTPELDSFAEESARFEDAWAQSCVTVPSHMSLLTGQYVHRHGLNDNGQTRTPTETLATVLKENGYRTAAFTGHGVFQARFGLGEGFEVFKTMEPGAAMGTAYWRHFDEVYPDALEFLAEHRTEPCFVVVHGYDPHQPYWPPDPWRTDYAGWYKGSLNVRNYNSQEYVSWIQQGRFGEDEARYVSDLYDGEIANADRSIGRFLKGLQKQELMDRSIVVFLSDHGESFGKGKFVGHVGLLEDVLAIPLMIRFPEAQYAGVYPQPVQLIDVLPTLLAALELEPAAGSQGTDLMPLLRGELDDLEPGRMRVAQWKNLYSVRFGKRWKFTARLEPDGRVTRKALYDLEADPEETKSLFGTPAGRKQFNTLFAHFEAWREQTSVEDASHAGAEGGPPTAEDLELLKALGYVGD